MKKKWLSVFLCTVMTAGLLAGCGSKEAEVEQTKPEAEQGETEEKEPCEITYYTWYQSPDGEYPENMIAAFEEKYPWITVNFEMGSQSPDEYVQTQKVKFLAGEGIDVTSIRPEMRQEYVDAGYLEDLTGQEFLNNYAQGYLDNVKVNGTVYSVPYAVGAIGVIYNKDLFAENGWEIPTCREEWLALCEEIAKTGITPMVNGLKDGWPMSGEVAPFMHKVYADNPEIFEQINQGEVKYTDPVFVDCFKEIEAYFHSDAVSQDAIGLTYDQAANYFATGKAAMICHGDWTYEPIMQSEPEFEVGVFQIPYNEKGEKQIGSVSVGSSQAIASSSKNKEAALLFLDYMSSLEGAQFFADHQSNFSAVTGVTQERSKAWNELLNAESIPFYYDQMYVGASNEMYKQLQLLFVGDVTVEEALANIQAVQDKKE